MFDGDQKVFLFLGAAVFGFLGIAGESLAPREEVDLAVETAGLPPLPNSTTPSGTPRQTQIPEQIVPLPGGYEATLLHGYVLEGTVVTRREYRRDATSDISPLDLGIVWGDLADRTDEFEFRNGNRAVFYQAIGDAPLPADWETHITNNHLIPATAQIDATLNAITPGQAIRIRGYLVEVNGQGIHPWRSSTRRDDSSIIGGCEIILVRGVEILSG